MIVFRKNKTVKNMLMAVLICTLPLTSMALLAATSKFLNVESFVNRPVDSDNIKSYGVNILSFTKPVNLEDIKNIAVLDKDFLYVNKVSINDVVYYRLISGNFATLKQAKKHLSRVKKHFSGAWVSIRRKVEKQELTKILAEKILLPEFKQKEVVERLPVVAPIVVAKVIPVITPKIIPAINAKKTSKVLPPIVAKAVPRVVPILVPKLIPRLPPRVIKKIKPKTVIPPQIAFAEKLLEQARQLFLDRNYARVVTVSNKIIEIGSVEQKQKAMEFVGIARERQRKFAQAVAIYSQFLNLYPESKLASKIKIRLTGLKTMRLDPKVQMTKNKRKKMDENWRIYGSLSQYYRDDVVDRDTLDSEQVNSSLVSDVNMYARRKTDKSVIVMRFDAGLVNDFLDKESETRLSRAMINYTNNESSYQLIGGRQSRTAKGVLGRFDGLVYKGLSHDNFDYSVFTGFPVQSSYDSLDSERQFLGSSIHFKPYEKVEMDVYVVQQQLSGLTDRQALGTEFQYRNDKGFLYGIIDYDIFYSDVNNITAITNYRYSDKLVFNMTYDYRNSPLLTTLNALQGQQVESMEVLQTLLSDQEIYQLAEDRTTKSQNIFMGSNYQIDDSRQLYMSLSLSTVEASVESGGVAAAPSTSDINFSTDYSVKGLLFKDDYTTLGVRLSDTSSSEIISLRARSRLAGSKGFRYDPRLRLDYRKSKTSEVDQYILKPSLKVTYKPNKKVSFEGSLGIEYSNFDLPELNDQTQYDVFLGYVYRF